MDPILRDIPEQIESDRLLLRCPRPGDGGVVNEAVRESAEALRGWMPWADPVPTIEESETFCRRSRAAFTSRTEFNFLIFERETELYVGGCGLHSLDWSVPRFEIGYWIRASRQGRGYAREAAGRLARFAFDDLGARRVEIRCDARNEASVSVASALGFEPESCLRAWSRTPGGALRDTLVFSRVVPDETD